MPTTPLVLALAAAHALQPPGTFHSGETVARDGEAWLALRVDGGAARLEPVTLRVERVVDEMLDGPGERSGESVRARDGADALVFVRGAGLRAGAVPSARLGAGEPWSTRTAQRIEFGGAAHELRTVCVARAATAGGDAVHAARANAADAIDCRVELARGSTVQTLARMAGYRDDAGTLAAGDEAPLSLLFAGDLDGDGRLDLILDLSHHYNVRRPTLLLSRPAAPGDLLQAAAVHEATGC